MTLGMGPNWRGDQVTDRRAQTEAHWNGMIDEEEDDDLPPLCDYCHCEPCQCDEFYERYRDREFFPEDYD